MGMSFLRASASANPPLTNCPAMCLTHACLPNSGTLPACRKRRTNSRTCEGAFAWSFLSTVCGVSGVESWGSCLWGLWCGSQTAAVHTGGRQCGGSQGTTDPAEHHNSREFLLDIQQLQVVAHTCRRHFETLSAVTGITNNGKDMPRSAASATTCNAKPVLRYCCPARQSQRAKPKGKANGQCQGLPESSPMMAFRSTAAEETMSMRGLSALNPAIPPAICTHQLSMLCFVINSEQQTIQTSCLCYALNHQCFDGFAVSLVGMHRHAADAAKLKLSIFAACKSDKQCVIPPHAGVICL